MIKTNLWKLFNQSTRKLISDQTDEQVFAILKNTSANTTKDWHLWKPGYPAWIPLPFCVEVLTVLRPESCGKVSPPPPGLVENAPPAKAKLTQVQFSNRRKHPRIAATLKVILISKTRTFRAFSQDISLGGLCLDKKAPDWSANEDCQILISSPDGIKAIAFVGRVLPDEQNPRRIIFATQNTSAERELSEWLTTIEKNQIKAA